MNRTKNTKRTLKRNKSEKRKENEKEKKRKKGDDERKSDVLSEKKRNVKNELDDSWKMNNLLAMERGRNKTTKGRGDERLDLRLLKEVTERTTTNHARKGRERSDATR